MSEDEQKTEAGFSAADILQANLSKQQECEPEVELNAPLGQRKRRDYVLGLIFVNLLLLLMSLNIAAALFCLSAMVIFTTGFTWVMWFLIDDY